MFSQNFACHDLQHQPGRDHPADVLVQQSLWRLSGMHRAWPDEPYRPGAGAYPTLACRSTKGLFAPVAGILPKATAGPGLSSKLWPPATSFRLISPFENLPADIRKIILFGNDGEVLTVDTTNSKYSHGSTYHATGSASSPAWKNATAKPAPTT